MTIFSPKSVGRHETRKSMSLVRPVVGEADLDAPVLRQPLLRDVELRHDLDARGDGVAELHRRRHDVVEDAVDAVADAQFLLVRLDVDVAGALLDRRHQHHVHQLDDRRLLALPGERLGADLLEVLEHLHVGGVAERHLFERPGRHVERARPARGRGLRCARVVLLQRLVDGRLRRHDRLDVVARHELDVVHGEHVRRVGHRDRQRRARAAERDDLVLLGGLGRDEPDDGRVDLELGEVDGGHAVLLAQQRRDVVVLDEPELDQVQAELPPVGLLVVQGLLELLRRDALLLEKQFPDSDRHGALAAE
jgi:hypothetical protein